MDFHSTVMGHKFFEGTMPNIYKALKKIEANQTAQIEITLDSGLRASVFVNTIACITEGCSENTICLVSGGALKTKESYESILNKIKEAK